MSLNQKINTVRVDICLSENQNPKNEQAAEQINKHVEEV